MDQDTPPNTPHLTRRVLVTDDHPAVRRGIRAMIDGANGITVVGEAEDGKEALRLAQTLAPDLVLMDVRMPRINGLQATKIIKEHRPTLPVVIYTSYAHIDYLHEAIEAGAASYVLKDATTHELVTSIVNVLEGESSMSPETISSILARMANEQPELAELTHPSPQRRDTDPSTPHLADQELATLQGIAYGWTNKEIAVSMHLSHHTVKTYVTRIIEKLRVSDRTQAAVRAIRLGVIDPNQSVPTKDSPSA